jgi:alpha-galactosidase
VRTLATAIALTGGSLLLSDDLPNLPRERMDIARALLPLHNEKARVIDWFDAEMPASLRLDLVNETGEWHLLAKFNWTEKPVVLRLNLKDFQLPDGEYFGREFWGGMILQLNGSKQVDRLEVPPHGCVLLSVRKIEEGQPLYVGSNLHFSQGMEVAEWNVGQRQLSATLRLPRRAAGKLILLIPWRAPQAAVDGVEREIAELGNGLYELELNVKGFSHLVVK